MSRSIPLLAFLIVAALLPAKTYAATANDQNTYGGFLYGQDQEEEKSPIVWQYSNKFKGKAPKISGSVDNILPQGQQFLYFVRTPAAKSNEATLRLLTPVTLNGCANISPPLVNVRKGGGMLAFTIENGSVALSKKTQYAHFQCDQATSSATADIVLNRDELMEGNVKTITFQTAGGAMDTYGVELTPGRLSLVQKTAFAFKPYMGTTKSDPLAYDFFPENVVILYAPSAPKGVDLSEKITALALSKGLTQSPLKNGSTLYFIDQPGTLAGTLDFDAKAYIGSVVAQETFQGTNGAYEQGKQVDVYAKRPGYLD